MTELMSVDHLKVLFPVKAGLVFDRTVAHVHAVDDVSFAINQGETLGIVGESGCGKTTLIRTLVRLIDPTSGQIKFRDADITKASRKTMEPIRREMQMVFQDPFGSFNPKATIGDSLTEPLLVHRMGDAAKRRARVAELLDAVGLPVSVLDRYPAGLSGGQLQRLSIARALSVGPAVVVADEPTSALDVSIQAQIVNLLMSVQREFGVTYLFISHDLPLVSLLADDVIVLLRGRAVESGPSAEVFDRPTHPYTRELLAAVPAATPAEESARRRARDQGPVVAPVGHHLSPAACPFADRCPHREQVCLDVRPPVVPMAHGHSAACHFAERLQLRQVSAVAGPADEAATCRTWR
jgi:oligopeptide transport system ATP-binding protein